jgi:hypothetical protein
VESVKNGDIFTEFSEKTAARDGNCFLRSLGIQPEDESGNNVPRDKAVQYICKEWERFCPVVAFYIMKITRDVRFYIHTGAITKCRAAGEKTECMERMLK